MILPDSGARREFATGAVRDIAEGKGRMDLIDIGFAAELFDTDPVQMFIDRFIKTKDAACLLFAFRLFAQRQFGDLPTALIEVSKHFEDGAKKYSANNWRKGIDLHCYIDSALRHYMKHLRGDNDEPHDRAFLWNIMCAHWTLENLPQMDDIDESYRPQKIDLFLEGEHGIERVIFSDALTPGTGWIDSKTIEAHGITTDQLATSSAKARGDAMREVLVKMGDGNRVTPLSVDEATNLLRLPCYETDRMVEP